QPGTGLSPDSKRDFRSRQLTSRQLLTGDLDDEQLELADRLERSLEESNLERGEPGGWRARLRGRRRASRQRA
ncbi:MAG: hypothetical protein QOJ01_2438, partial [Solirubrobacterales bacterium]|nr:hypothetical protein [Solirubrobacterales bacterium]